MFEGRVILMQLIWFATITSIVSTSVFLTENGTLSKDIFPYSVVTIFLTTILFWIWFARYQNRKTFGPLIKDQLADSGYSLISERPRTLSEILSTMEFTVGIVINGMPLQAYAYKAQNERMLHVRNWSDEEFLLHVIITKTWKNKIKLEILKTRRVQQE